MPAAGVTVADIQAIKRICGAGGWVDGGGVDAAAFTVDRREKFHGRAALIAMPGSAAEVAEVLRHCNARGIGVVPQGGNTGMAGGATPSAGGGQIILHLGRMNRIREVDRANSTVSAEAGCVLAAVQEAARREGLLFPLAMGSQGSCMVGGALSTNAGGVRVLRYGNARELTLGLEVALADGRVLDGMNKLRKNNSGYDWKQWFIGAEGTLGVVTAAVLRLFPDESQAHTCWLALGGARDAVRLLGEFRGALGGALSCFEFMEGECVAQVLRAIPGVRNPLAKNYPAYVLAQSGAQSAAAAGGEILPALLARLLDENKILDAAIAAGEAQAANLWKIRESIPEAEKKRGGYVKHDISLPLSTLANFMAESRRWIAKDFPGAVTAAFGHVGDGNLHFNVRLPDGADADSFTEKVYAAVHAHGGSFSAEHGIGQLRKKELLAFKSAEEIALMRQLKETLDPGNIMNPGKVLDWAATTRPAAG